MNPTPIDYQQQDLVGYLTFGNDPIEDFRVVKIAWRTDDIKHGRPGFVGEEMGGAGDGAKVWGYDDQIVWARTPTGRESFRWRGNLGDPHFEKFCDWWHIRYRWTTTGVQMRIKNYWKPVAPGAVIVTGEPAT
jgi:hypothetical protein